MPLVRDGMSTEVLLAAPDETLHDVARRMRERHVGSAVVEVPGREAPGILTERDIVHALAEDAAAGDARVGDHCTLDVTTAGTDWSLEDAARSMLRRGFRHLVVLDDDGGVEGVVSMRDVVRGIVGEGERRATTPSEPDD